MSGDREMSGGREVSGSRGGEWGQGRGVGAGEEGCQGLVEPSRARVARLLCGYFPGTGRLPPGGEDHGLQDSVHT